MLHVFTPKYYTLFPYFEISAGNLIMAAEQLKLLMQTHDFEKQIDIIKRINELKKSGDNVTYDIYSLLNRLFIVPFDREDIVVLVNKVDNVVDSIFEIAKMIHYYKLSELLSAFSEIAEIIYLASYEIDICLRHLRDVSGSRKQIIEGCKNMNQLKKKADEIFYSGILGLFSPDTDMIHLSKGKEVLETLKKCVGETNVVAEKFKRILIKSS